MRSKIFILKNKKKEAHGVFTLKFLPQKGKIFDFKAGQFALFRILKENFSNIFGKAYTITSLPDEDFLAITVKRMGKFSNALCDLKVKDEVGVTGPFGNLYSIDSWKKDIVFLAGGVGVTPFYAVIKDFYKKGIDRKITLFYSNRNKIDITFLKDLEEISEKWKNLKVVNVLTREQKKYPNIREYERINISMIKKYLGDLKNKDYFICGSSNFVADIKGQLKNSGVGYDCIKIETFY